MKTWNYYVVQTTTGISRGYYEVARTLLGTDFINSDSQVLKTNGTWSSADEGHRFPSRKVVGKVMRRHALAQWTRLLRGGHSRNADRYTWLRSSGHLANFGKGAREIDRSVDRARRTR